MANRVRAEDQDLQAISVSRGRPELWFDLLPMADVRSVNFKPVISLEARLTASILIGARWSATLRVTEFMK